jgi:hypothetical protein
MGSRLLCAWVALLAPAAFGLGCASLQGLSGGDAGGDAGASTDATLDVVAEARGPAGWCGAHPHAFCDDFDEPPSPGGWDMPAGDAGTLMVTDAVASSPPNSVAISMTPSSGQPTSLSLRAVLAGGAKSIECRMAIFFDKLLSNPAEVMNIALESASLDQRSYDVSIHVGSDNATLVEYWIGADGGEVVLSSALPIPTATVWTDVTLTVGQPSMGAQGIIVTLNGTPVLSIPGSAPPNTGQIVGVGVTYNVDPSEPWALHVDNFACDVTP